MPGDYQNYGRQRHVKQLGIAGDNQFLRPGVSFSLFQPVGGETSIRGHKRRSIHQRDAGGNPRPAESGAILSGDSFVHLNLEYHFLVGGPFRVLLFADAGNVFGEGQPFDLADLRTTAGVELRVLLPVFGAPLRFIYATNLDPRPQDDFEDFKFSIGTSF